MDSNQKAIADKLNPMSLEDARQAIKNGTVYVGDFDSPNYKYARSLLAEKEAALRAAHDAEMLSINRKALDIMSASKKKKWYETFLGILALGIVASLLAWLILHFFGIA